MLNVANHTSCRNCRSCVACTDLHPPGNGICKEQLSYIPTFVASVIIILLEIIYGQARFAGGIARGLVTITLYWASLNGSHLPDILPPITQHHRSPARQSIKVMAHLLHLFIEEPFTTRLPLQTVWEVRSDWLAWPRSAAFSLTSGNENPL